MSFPLIHLEKSSYSLCYWRSFDLRISGWYMKPWVALASVQISGFPGIPSISNVGPKTAVKSSSIIITQLECHFLLAQVLVLTMVFGLWLFRIPPFGKQHTLTYVTYVAYSPPKGFIWSNLSNIDKSKSFVSSEKEHKKKKLI